MNPKAVTHTHDHPRHTFHDSWNRSTSIIAEIPKVVKSFLGSGLFTTDGTIWIDGCQRAGFCQNGHLRERAVARLRGPETVRDDMKK